jgi:AraC-like DNA-binding protein
MIGISALLRELVLRTIRIPVDYDEQGQDARIIATLLGEIDWTPLNPVSLPPLRAPRLRRMEEMLMRTPNDRSTLDQWAERLEISPRTLTRLLRREAHLSFQAWRDQVRAFAALPLIAERRPLAEVAESVGYETAWSFTAMFKRVTGKVPSRYLSTESNGLADTTDSIEEKE